MRALVTSLAVSLILACGGDAPTRRPEHLVLITVDTLRADRLGAYGYAEAATPNIDALAREALRFDRAYAHSSMTLPSIASLLTGVLPAEHGIYSNHGALKAETRTLAERVHEADFDTAAFIGSFALRPNRRLSRGFDRYTRDFADEEAVRKHPENHARRLTDEAIAWLDRRDPAGRFLLWIHYQEPHGPYTPPTFRPAPAGGPVLPRSESVSGRGAIPSYQWLGHGRLAEYEARYDGEIAEVDRQLGRLLQDLRKRALLDRSVVAFTADHGEAFGEDDLYCAHSEGLDETLLRVPLLLRAPGVDAGVRSDVVRLVDLAPTLLSLLGLDAQELPGRSLLAPAGDRPVVAQLVRRGERWRSLRDRGFELRESGTGARITPLAVGETAAPAEVGALHAELERLAPWPTLVPVITSPEEADALRAMGYVE